MVQTKTELHTHLMGILPPQDFLEFIIDCGIDEITWPFDGKVHLVEELLDPVYAEKLFIKWGTSVSYPYLNRLYYIRTEIIKEVCQRYKGIHGLSGKKTEVIIYNKFINTCLRSLVDNGVEYVDISYSFANRIANFVLAPDLVGKIDYKFLLSTDRNNLIKALDGNSKTFTSAAKDLEVALKSKHSVGFDIMGQETALGDDEKNYYDEYHSFERKMELILEKLVGKDNTVFRIHSGETVESFNNSELVLTYLDNIVNRNGFVIPPPEIRLGHGIQYNDEDLYVSLLKKYKVIVELNASSNLALSNVPNYEGVPYEFYDKHEIPYLVSTDGHGFYDTTTLKEDKICRVVAGRPSYDKLIERDIDYIVERGGR